MSMKQLVIAEKPSVASDLSKVLGVKKNGDFYENEEYIISSAVGHLVELFMPDDIDPKLKFWSLKTLPILPETFQVKPIEKTKKKLDELTKLLKRKDIECVINACDAGREGELIFTYIYELSKSKLPKKRLWMSSMTPESIRQAFKDLRDDTQMAPLRDAAKCRSESDWLIGINGTRAMTARIYGNRARQAATVGRVQTPTLTIVLEREIEIRNFQPRTFWRLSGKFKVTQGEYEGTLQRPGFKKVENDPHDRIDRFWEEKDLEAILLEIEKLKEANVNEEKKRSKQQAPRLYDLTTLQREANTRFGFPAGMTLKIAQSLYEKHKAITYPRTDSKALPEDYISNSIHVLKTLDDPALKPFAQEVVSKNWVTPNKRIFNNKEVSDHFAITPTDQSPKKLSEEESKIYDMIAKRFIAVFFPPAEYDVTTRISSVSKYNFKTEGKVLAEPGWLAVYGREGQTEANLVPLSSQDGSPTKAAVLGFSKEEDQTRPPPRYTEATLLAAMEGAGKLVEDEELAEAMKEKGLGTPATRAQIIDHLVHEKYLERSQRELIPTARAESLIEFLRAIDADALASPRMTGEWEYKLRLIQEGKLSREEFMHGIRSMTTKIVEQARNFTEENFNTRETEIISPTDRKPMIEMLRSYQAQDSKLVIYKTIGNRKISEEEVRTLVRDGKIGPLDNFRSKMGKPYSAVLAIDAENKVKFVFENQGLGGEGEEINYDEFPTIAQCPKAARGLCDHSCGDIKETPSAYVCAHNNPKESKCNFRVSRTLLGKAVPTDQFLKLVNEGKTDLLDKFQSKKTRRFFSAHLILKEDASIGFEFAAKKSASNSNESATKATAIKKAPPKKKKVASKKEVSLGDSTEE